MRTVQHPVMRTPLIAGNWKMNTDLDEAIKLAGEVAAAAQKAKDVDVAVCVPFPFLVPVKDVLKSSNVKLGAQDCYFEEEGAYTAAVSTKMLASVGCDYIVTGHSERRAIFGDTDADVNKKVSQALVMHPLLVLCRSPYFFFLHNTS